MPREGHDQIQIIHRENNGISIHVPREGHDRLSQYTAAGWYLLFLSTCPVRGTTATASSVTPTTTFLSTCPVRGTTRFVRPRILRRDISIHVPREGHDPPEEGLDERVILISIHVPREGHDKDPAWAKKKGWQFLSTCPVRGTTGAGKFFI